MKAPDDKINPWEAHDAKDHPKKPHYQTSVKEITEYPDHPALTELNQGKKLMFLPVYEESISLPRIRLWSDEPLKLESCNVFSLRTFKIYKKPIWSDETTLAGYRIITAGVGGYIIFNPDKSVDVVRNLAGEIASRISNNTKHRPLEKKEKGEPPKLKELYQSVWRVTKLAIRENNRYEDGLNFKALASKEIIIEKNYYETHSIEQAAHLIARDIKKAEKEKAKLERAGKIQDLSDKAFAWKMLRSVATGDFKTLEEIAAYVKFLHEFEIEEDAEDKQLETVCEAIRRAAHEAGGVPERLVVLEHFNSMVGANQKRTNDNITDFLERMGFGWLPAPASSEFKIKPQRHVSGSNRKRELKKKGV